MMKKMENKTREFREECALAAAKSHALLRTILQENAKTEYGRKHHFGEIKDLREYRRLPLTQYADYEESIARMQAGEENILTAYPIKYFLTTSGSSGKQKRVPLTERALQQGWDLVYAASLAQKEGMAEKKHLHTSVFRIAEGERETLLSCAYFWDQLERDPSLCERYIGGKELLFHKDIGDVCYVKLWLALSEPALYSIQSIFLYDLLLLLQYFTKNWKGLLSDLRTRTLHPEMPLNAQVQQALLAQPVPAEAWLEKVERECEKGFDGIVHRIWGECAFVSGIGGGSFAAQEQSLRRLLGDIPLHYFTYTSTEALIGIAVEEEKEEYVCIPSSGFLEFLPYEEDTEETKWMEDLEIGKRYELIVTNFSGLYRYRLLDVVEVVGFYGEAPIIRFQFRKNIAVNIAGEKTDLMMIEHTIAALAERERKSIFEYSVCVDKSILPCRYCFFIEGDGDSMPENGAFLDEFLCKENPDYADLRYLGEIGQPICRMVEQGSHQEWKRMRGKGGHNKPQPYYAEEGFDAFMMEREKPHGKGK